MKNLTLKQFVAHKAQNPKTKNDFLYQEDRANGIADKWVRRQFAKAIKPQVGQQFKMTHTQTKFDFVYEITAIENKEYTFKLISEASVSHNTFTHSNGKEGICVFTFPAEFKASCTYGKFNMNNFKQNAEDHYVAWIPCTKSLVDVESGKNIIEDQDPTHDAYQLVLCEEEVITVDSAEEVVAEEVVVAEEITVDSVVDSAQTFIDSEEKVIDSEIVDSQAILFSDSFTPYKRLIAEYRKLITDSAEVVVDSAKAVNLHLKEKQTKKWVSTLMYVRPS